MAKVVHFEIPIADPKKAIPFYEKVLGWQFQAYQGGGDYWLATTGPESEQWGIGGALMLGEPRSGGTVITIAVPSLAEARSKVTANGGKVTTDVQTIPGVGEFCYVEDAEGNTLGFLQPTGNM